MVDPQDEIRLIVLDKQGTVVTCNPACERLFGYRADEVVGRNIEMLMTPPLRDGRPAGALSDMRGRRKDGTIFPIALSVVEASDGGRPIFVAAIRDTSDRRRTGERLVQAQKMEAIGQLSGGIAHDFNNLLTVIVGNAELLAEKLRGQPDLARIAETIAAAGERGAELTGRLLAFGRRQALQPAQIDCNDLIQSMRDRLRRALRPDIAIDLSLDPRLWPVFADATQIESAILDLARNAQDSMPHGGSLNIATANAPLDDRYFDLHPEVSPGRYVMIAVSDDGEGMPADVLERAFEPFFTTRDVGKGSGLGLSMVYGFVKQSNGHVTISSDVGLGTTVRLYFPAAAGALESEAAPPPAAAGEQGIRETVLVTEDDPFIRAYAVACLESLGYRAVAVADGRDALAWLGSGADADVLFTDILMPGGLSGWELAQRARQIRPSIKILFTSGYAPETLAARGRLPPGAVVLTKPYRKTQLGYRLRELLDAGD